MNIAVLVLGAVLVLAAYALALKRPKETFEWTAPKGTYMFGSAIPEDATALDKTLGRLVDAVIPKDVVDGGGTPEAQPYTDSEAEELAKRTLARIKDRSLSFVSVEYVGKSGDKNGNTYYDIAFMAYDKDKTMAAKLALTALVTQAGRTYIRRFSSFDQKPQASGVEGTSDFGTAPATFLEELGIDYTRLYK